MTSDEADDAAVIKLTRRRALAGLATIGVGSAAAGAGTFAAFSDSDSTTGGFDAGTLTLSMGGTSLSFSAGDIEPGDSGNSSVSLSPSGTLTGDLTPELASVSGTAGKDSTADLEQHLELKIWLDDGGSDDGTYDNADIALRPDGTSGSGKTPSYATVANYNSVSWTDAITGMSSDWSFHVDWRLPSDTSNEAQGDQLDTTFNFTLQ